jgi:hypothetical protein
VKIEKNWTVRQRIRAKSRREEERKPVDREIEREK